MNRKRSDTDEQRDERRFDTTSLLQGVEASDASLDDILQEFGSVTVKPAPLTAGGKPHVEDSRAYADADTIWASLEAEIREEIDADRAAAAKAAAAEPAAGKATKPAAVKPTAGTAAKSAAAEPAGGTAAPAQRTQTAQQQPAQTAQKNTAAGSRTAAQSGQAEKPPLSGAETLRASRFHFVELDLHAEPAPLQQQVQSPQQTVQSAQRSVQTQKTGQTARKPVQAQEAGQTAQKPEQAQKAGQAARKPEQAQKAGQTARKPVQAERTARAEKSTAGRRTQAAASVQPDIPAPEAPLPHSPVPDAAPPGQPYGETAAPVRTVFPDLDAAEPQQVPPERQRRRQKPEEPPAEEPSPAAALRAYSSSRRSMRARLMPAMLLSILAGLLTLSAAMGWTVISFFETALNRNLILIVLLGLTVLLCFDVIIEGIRDLFHLRLAMPALALLSTCLVLAEALINLQDATPSFCAAGCFMLTLTLQAGSRRKLAACRSLKVLASSAELTDVRSVTGIRESGACLIRTAGSREGFITDLEKTDQADTVLSVYGPLLLAAALAAALALHTALSVSFFWLWAALVCAGLPLAAGSCFCQPWALIAGRLQRSGAALSGWHGVRTLCGAEAVTVLDEDIYPQGTVQLSGMKLFENYRAELVVGYAASLILPLGGSLAAPFQALQEEQGAQTFEPTGLRAFEGGGIGGDIRGDVVLAGSMSFMQLMGIRLPRGTNVRQAVYVAINGELAGLFAVSWQKSRGTRKALQALSREPAFQTVFAVRDFLMSPALLRQLFNLPGEGLEYPRVEVRMALSRPMAPGTGRRGAILTQNTLPALSETVCGAAHLRRTVRRSLLLTIILGLAGAGLTAAALLLGLRQGLLPLLVLLYGLLGWLILSISGRLVLRF